MSSLKIVIVVRRGLVKIVLETLGLWCPTVVGNSLQSCMRGWGTFRDWSSVSINKRRNTTIMEANYWWTVASFIILLLCAWTGVNVYVVVMCLCWHVNSYLIVWVYQCGRLALFPGLSTIHFSSAYSIHTTILWLFGVYIVYTYNKWWKRVGRAGNKVVANVM